MMIDNTAGALHAAIAAVCPIHGVSIGRSDDKATWRIDFADEANPQQVADAQVVLANFDRAVEAEKARVAREREAAVQVKLRALAERLVDDPGLLDKLAPRRP